MPDPVTRVLALKAGEVDIDYDIPREATQEIASTDGLRVVTSTVGAYEALYFNIHGKEPYDLGQEPAIRRAVAYAIDKDAIVNGVWQGNAESNNTMVPADVLGESARMIQGTPYDPDMAQKILDESGWVEGSDGIREKDGRRLQLTMVVGYPSAEIHRPMPEFVQAQLKDIGIALEIVQTPDAGAYRQRLQLGEGDLWAEVGNQSDGDPCFLPEFLFYSPDPGGEPASDAYAFAFAPGKQFDTFIDQCFAATTIEEVQQAAAGGMKVLIDDEFIVIPLAGIFRIYGVWDKVEVFEAHPSQYMQRWTDVSVKASA
jgi:peptide/nickel transport system substrate-binding protein